MSDSILTSKELTALRRAFARQMLGITGISDPPLERALSVVRRETFLGPEPWHVFRVPDGAQRLPVDDPVYAYQDVLFTLVPERGINNGGPSLHTRMLHALDVLAGARIAHIGIGTGYYTAIIAELVGDRRRVLAVEYDEHLAEAARANLAPWPNVTVICADGAAWPEEEVDRVYVNFAVETPADPWIERLGPGGKLLFPLGVARPAASGPKHARYGAALLVARGDLGLAVRYVCPAYFIFAAGALSADDTARETLHLAFKRGGVEFVKSVRWKESADPGRCWFWSPKWSLAYDDCGD